MFLFGNLFKNTLVFSKSFYCSSVWSFTSACNIRRLQYVQNFAARIVCSVKKYELITSTLKNLRWLPVKTHLYCRDAILAFKCMSGCAPKYLTSQFITRGQISGRVTRNSQSLDIPFFRTATGQRTFYYRIVSIWNNLNPSFKLERFSMMFTANGKRQIHVYVFSKYIISIQK